MSPVWMPKGINSLRKATIFTVYSHTPGKEEKKIWEFFGSSGDLLLTDRQLSSKSANTNLGFEKEKQIVASPAGIETILHTYVTRKGPVMNASTTGEGYPRINFGTAGPISYPRDPHGLIAEFIIYDRVLENVDIAKIESYLALKYGITLKKNYVNSLGEVIWDRKLNEAYSNNIVGIGRDDLSTLYQKQGTSITSPEQLVIGVKSLHQLNSENSGEIGNGDFLIWGDNGESLLIDPGFQRGADEISLSKRKWIMQPSGPHGLSISTALKVETNKFVATNISKEEFYLIIDRSGFGDFFPGNCIYVRPDSISEKGVASFSEVYWDTDGSGKDAFTFGIKSASSKDKPDIQAKSTVRLMGFMVYPNPIIDGNYKLSIILDKPTDILVEVFDLSQRLIDSKKVAGQTSYLLPGYIKGAAGTYMIRITTQETKFYRMIVLQ